MPADRLPVTDDAMLGGRLRLLQPKRGHRFGHDAVLLAASVPAKGKEHAVEFGAGVGAASLALLARVPGARVSMIEIDPALTDLAAQNVARNGFADCARVIVLDAGAAPRAFSAEGLGAGCADHVFMNPPFHDESHRASPNEMKRRAHMATRHLLSHWIAAGTRLLRAKGTLTVIWRADGLPSVLDALSAKFGWVTILRVHGKEGGNAIRVIVQAVKGGPTSLTLLPPLVLNGRDNHPTADAEKVMRDLAPLALAEVISLGGSSGRSILRRNRRRR